MQRTAYSVFLSAYSFLASTFHPGERNANPELLPEKEKMTRTRVRSGLSGDVLYAGDLTAEHSFLKNIPPDDDPRDPDYQPSVSGNSNDGGRGRASTINGVDLKARSAKKRKPAGKASNMSPEKRKRLQERSVQYEEAIFHS